jgi:hypothetical protein
VTKAAVERIRGVDSDYTIRSLLHRRLVVELGRSDAAGRPFLYGHGFEFPRAIRLTTLDELPPLEVDVAARLAEEGGSSKARQWRRATRPRRRSRNRATPLPPTTTPERCPPSGSRRCSRRRAWRAAGRARGLIAAGRVTVDGKRATLGQQVDPDKAVILLDGRPIGAAAQTTYLLLNKPGGVTSTTRDRHAATTVLDLVPTALIPEGARLYPVGRLDQDSEGLLILTNDGAWSERVLHPRFGVEREYAIGVAWPLTPDQQATLERGVELEEGRRDGPQPAPDVGDRGRPARRPARPGAATRAHLVPGGSCGRAGSASCGGCSGRSTRRSSGSSGSGSGRSARRPPLRADPAAEGARGARSGRRRWPVARDDAVAAEAVAVDALDIGLTRTSPRLILFLLGAGAVIALGAAAIAVSSSARDDGTR